MSRKIKLLTKDEMIASGMTHNYEIILAEYLNAMPFNDRERKEIKLAMDIKINSAFDRVISGKDKKALKKLDKRFKELKKAAEEQMNKSRRLTAEEEKEFLSNMGKIISHRTQERI